MLSKPVTLIAAVVLSLATSAAIAQTAAQHNGPGGPKDKVENFVRQHGLELPPPPPAPPPPTVSTTTATSPASAPPKKN